MKIEIKNKSIAVPVASLNVGDTFTTTLSDTEIFVVTEFNSYLNKKEHSGVVFCFNLTLNRNEHSSPSTLVYPVNLKIVVE